MVLISLLTRMLLTAKGLPAASVPFDTNAGQLELLIGEEALQARRQVAADHTPETLRALRKMPTSFANWRSQQLALSAAGLRVCPTSGTPVMNVDGMDADQCKAWYDVQKAMAKAVNGGMKETDVTDLYAALDKASRLTQPPSDEGVGQERHVEREMELEED